MVHRRIREEREKHDSEATIWISGTPGMIEAKVMCGYCKVHASFRIRTSNELTAAMWLLDEHCPACTFLPQWKLLKMDLIEGDPLALHEGTIH